MSNTIFRGWCDLIIAVLVVFLVLSGVVFQTGNACVVTNEASPFVVMSITGGPNSVVIKFESCPDHVYQVETAQELSTESVWTVQTVMIGQEQATTWEDTGAAGLAQRYWRVRRLSSDTDSDGDGMPNGWELQYGLNPLDPGDAHTDLDGDGTRNLTEFLQGRDPTKSAVADTGRSVNLNVFTPLE